MLLNNILWHAYFTTIREGGGRREGERKNEAKLKSSKISSKFN